MSRSFEPLAGLIAPLLTPFDHDMSVATDLYVEHAHRLLEEGCVGLAPFGTTGEALSLGIDERRAALEALVDAGIDPGQLQPGTGLTNLPDTIELTTHALRLGCRATMVLPPFFVKAPPDAGIHHYFARLIDAVGDDARIVLYHIPQVAGVGFTPELVAELHEAFPRQVVAVKDSSGDWANTLRLLEIGELTVYPGSELRLPDALDRGSPGCISATANSNAPAIVEVINRHRAGDHVTVNALHAAVVARRLVFEKYSPIPAQKHLLAEARGDDRWRNVRPPLLPLSTADGQALAAALATT